MRLAPLIGIEALALVLIIAETYLFFFAIVPLGAVPHSITEYTAMTVLKLGLTFGLGVLWLVVMVGVTRVYVRSKLKNPTPTPSS